MFKTNLYTIGISEAKIQDSTGILKKVAERYPLQPSGPRERETMVFLDTFDWRCWNRNFYLRWSGRELALVSRTTWEVVESVSCEQPPVNSPLVEDSPAYAMLSGIVGVRLLLAVVPVELEHRTFNLVNEDIKTVMLLEREDFYQAKKLCHRRLKLKELRGYSAEFSEVMQSLDPLKEADGDFFRFCRPVRQPAEYLNHKELSLSGEPEFAKASKQLLTALTLAMKQQVPGICENLDTEYLHDFRVCVRKMRSYFSILNEFIDSEKVAPHTGFLKWLGTQTGPLRDLHVYLLNEKPYKALVAPAFREALNPFFSYIAGKEQRAHRELVCRLESAEFREGLARWEAFLAGAEFPLTSRARSVKYIARRVLNRFFKRALRKGQELTTASPDEKFHKLRIYFKKLRYGVEFFKAYFPAPVMDSLVKPIKKVQDNLGLNNDLFVQQEWLSGCYREMEAEGKLDLSLARALGGLITALYNEQKGLKFEFFDRFSWFTGKDAKQILTKYFYTE